MTRLSLLLLLSFLLTSALSFSQVVLDFEIELPADLAEPFSVDAGEDQVFDGESFIQLGADPTVSGGWGGPVYSWEPAQQLDAPNSSNPVVLTLSGPTEFIVTVSEAGVCEVSDTVFVDYTVGTYEVPKTELRLWPNPTTGVINLSTEKKVDMIILTELSGRTVAQFRNISSLDQISLETFSSGVYLLRVDFFDGLTQFVRVCKSE